MIYLENHALGLAAVTQCVHHIDHGRCDETVRKAVWYSVVFLQLCVECSTGTLHAASYQRLLGTSGGNGARVSTFGPTQARSKMRRVVARIALCALCARAAVPPLDPDAREEAADLIVVGRIVSATAEEVSRREGHVDSVSIGQLEVEVALKGDAAATQTVYWWYPSARPAGWTGHQGQAPAPPENVRIKVFADAHGELLVPNGWEAAPAAAAAPEAAADADAAGATGAAAEPSADAVSADADADAATADAAEVVERRENPIRALIRSFFKVLGSPFALIQKLFGGKKP